MGVDYRNRIIARAINLKITDIYASTIRKDYDAIKSISDCIFNNANAYELEKTFKSSIVYKEETENGFYNIHMNPPTREISHTYGILLKEHEIEIEHPGTISFGIHNGNVNTDYGKWGVVYCVLKCGKCGIFNNEYWDKFTKIDSFTDALELLLEEDVSIAVDLYKELEDGGSINNDIKVMASKLVDMVTKLASKKYTCQDIESVLRLWSHK